MNCPVCFFRDKIQKELKEKTFGISRFENKLIKYKEAFVSAIRNMDSLRNCSCYDTYNHSDMISWTDAFIKTLKSNIIEIERTFDSIISFYNDYIEKNQKIALDNFWHYLESNELLSGTDAPIYCSNLFFRGRERQNIDIGDINWHFHIPFTKRHRIKNQRFSINGQPMLYLGGSVPTIEKELNLPLNDLAIAAFLPKNTHYSYHKVYYCNRSQGMNLPLAS
jgi:hypothetical protein